MENDKIKIEGGNGDPKEGAYGARNAFSLKMRPSVLKMRPSVLKMRPMVRKMRSMGVLGVVSVVGTALSIFLIMVVVMMQQVKTAPYSPESNRDRMMYVTNNSIHDKSEKGYESNGPWSYAAAKEIIGELKTPETISFVSSNGMSHVNISIPGKPSTSGDIMATDANFFKIFDFSFLEGKPYDQATFEAGQQVAVISKSVAKGLFGNTKDALGKEIMIDHMPFKVIGVVKDVSTLATHAYSQVWVPFTTDSSYQNTWDGNGLMGGFSAMILAKSPKDFDAIKKEFEQRVAAKNKSLESVGWEIITRGRPYAHEQEALGSWANGEPDLEGARRTRWTIYLILLIVPAINLSGMTESRLRRRTEEIGVRRAFGCSRREIFMNLVWENLLTTTAAGFLGWLLSVVFAWLCGSMLFAQPFNYSSAEPTVDIWMLVQPSTFLWALGFCFVLNLLSSGVPAWRASRIQIVEALK